MAAIFCVNKNTEEYKNYVSHFGETQEAEHYIQYLYNKNNGNPLHNTPFGEPSILYAELLKAARGDEGTALRSKAMLYNDRFIRRFGIDWTTNKLNYKEYDVDVNGEPSIASVQNYFNTRGRKEIGEVEIASKIYPIYEGDSDVINSILDLEHDGASLLMELIKNPDTKHFLDNKLYRDVIDLLANSKLNLDAIKVKLGPIAEETALMQYDRKTHTITIDKVKLDQGASLEGFYASVIHELVHGVTLRALRFPMSPEDHQFRDDMKWLYDRIKDSNQSYLIDEYGMTNVEEFVSVFFSNDQFNAKIKKIHLNFEKKTVWQKIFEFLGNLFSLKVSKKFETVHGPAIHSYITKAFETFISNSQVYLSRDVFDSTNNEKIVYTAITTKLADVKQNINVDDANSIVEALNNLKATLDTPDTKAERALKDNPMLVIPDVPHEYDYINDGKLEPIPDVESVTTTIDNVIYATSKEEREAKHTDEEKEKLDMASNRGNAIHQLISNVVNKTEIDIPRLTGHSISDVVSEQLFGTIDQQISGEYGGVLGYLVKLADPNGEGNNKILSEMPIVDLDNKLVGTIDLVIINNKNEVHLFDFKTKTSFAYYSSTEYGPKIVNGKKVRGRSKTSDMIKYRSQLELYARILKKTLGITVAKKHVVMLQVVTTDRPIQLVTEPANSPLLEYATSNKKTTIPHIESVTLAKNTAPSDVDIYNGVDTPTRDVGESDLVRRIFKTIDSEQVGNYPSTYVNESSITSRIEQLKLKLNDPNHKANALRSKLINTLEDRLSAIQRRHSESDTEDFSKFLDELMQENSIAVSFAMITKQALNDTAIIFDEIKKVRAGTLDLTDSMLGGWRDYVNSYRILAQLAYEFSVDESLADKTTYDTLVEVNKLRNEIEIEYKNKARDLLSKRLFTLYDGVRVQRKNEYAKTWRTYQYSKEHNTPYHTTIEDEDKILLDSLSEEAYVSAKFEREAKDIDDVTYDLIYGELSSTSSTSNDVKRWLEPGSESSDPVFSSVVKLWTSQHLKHRRNAIEKKTQFMEVLQEYEKYMASKGGNKVLSMRTEKEIWSRFLEHEDGDTTGFLLSPVKSSYHQAHREMNAEANKKTEEAASILRRMWNKNNLKELTETAYMDYYNSMTEYIYSLNTSGEISNENVDKLINAITFYEKGKYIDYIQWGKYSKEVYDEKNNLVQPAYITKDVADKLYKWQTSHKKLYTTPADKWHNSEWDSFIGETIGREYVSKEYYEQYRALEASTNPMAKMYMLFLKVADETDGKIPRGFYIDHMLPGISKSKNERLRDSNPIDFVKGELSQAFFVKSDDELRNPSVRTDSAGNKLELLPVMFTSALSDEDQSYDLPTIYYRYWVMGDRYANNREIISTLELAKEFIDTRKTIETDAKGNPLFRRRKSRYSSDEVVEANNNKIAEQFDAWFNMYVLGNKTTAKIWNIGGLQFDSQKFIQALNSYTSINLLSLNFVQGISNIAIGEVMTAVDAISKEYFTAGELTKATQKYVTLLPGIVGDIGARRPTSLGSLLLEEFDVLNEGIYGDGNFSNRTRMKSILKSESLQFVNMAGEAWLRSRAFLAMLSRVKAVDSNGNELGNMIDMYEVKNNRLVIKEEVDLIKSNWTTKDQDAFFSKFHHIMYNTHGAYGTQEKVAAEMSGLTQLAYLFRRFIFAGWVRRYGRNQYRWRSDSFNEGSYITTAKFMNMFLKNLRGFQLSVIGENWAGLSTHEKANIQRTISEVAFLAIVWTLAGIAYKQWSDDDKDDDWYWAMMAYQAYRLKSELLFFSPKLDEAMSLLRSPMASMSQLENVINLISQLFNPAEVYERGPWKGHLKLTKDVIQLVPVYKQFYKLRDIEEQIQWFR